MNDTLIRIQKEQLFWLEQLDRIEELHNWTYSQFSDFVKGKTLELGSGIGTYTKRLVLDASHVTSIDLDDDFIRHSESKFESVNEVNVIKADVTNLAQSLTGYDTIVMMDLLEHVENDVSLLKDLVKRLSPDGRIIIKVPAFQWLYGTLDESINHHRRYTLQSIKSVFDSAGLDVVYGKYFNALSIPGWWVSGNLMKSSTPHAVNFKLFEKLLPVAKLLDKLLAGKVGLTAVAIGKVR